MTKTVARTRICLLLVAIVAALGAPVASADLAEVPGCGIVSFTEDQDYDLLRLIAEPDGYIAVRRGYQKALLTGHGRDAIMKPSVGGQRQRDLEITDFVGTTRATEGPTTGPRLLVEVMDGEGRHRLLAFDLDGEQVTSFGSNGVLVAPDGWYFAEVVERPSGGLAIFQVATDDAAIRILLTTPEGATTKTVDVPPDEMTGPIAGAAISGEDHAWILTWQDSYGFQTWVDRIALGTGVLDDGFTWDAATDPNFIANLGDRLLAVDDSAIASLHGTSGAKVSSFGSGGQVDLTGFFEGGITTIGDAPGERVVVAGPAGFSPNRIGAVMLGTGGVVTSVGDAGRFGPVDGDGAEAVIGLATGEVVIEGPSLGKERAAVLGPDGALATDCGQLRKPRVDRKHGNDRYETAAALVATIDTADVVVVATGNDFPDALAGGAAAAAFGGPLLLVTKGDVPTPTREQLSRLRPSTIVVMGGPNSVSDSVLTFLQQQPWGPTVERISGDDRYATAIRASQRAFPQGSDWVFVATGTGFADALAAVPVAAYHGGPILLTSGPTLSDALLAEIDRLDPTEVVIVGGPNSVSYNVESYFYERELYPQRFAGQDRFHTAAKLGALLPTETGAVFLASGAVFADALAAGPIAGRRVAPLLLTSADTLPEQARAEMARRSAQVVYVAGGPNSVGDGVLSRIDGTTLGYTFVAYRDEAETDPLQWDGCRPIPWRWYRGESPDSDLQFLKDGLAVLSKQTGVTFAYEGTTTIEPENGSSPDFVSVGFVWMFSAGLAGPQIQGPGAHYTGGTVAVSAGLSGQTWDGKNFASLVLAHEVGHLLGLAHVRSPLELMTDGYLEDSHSEAVFQIGDKAGLARSLDFSRC